VIELLPQPTIPALDPAVPAGFVLTRPSSVSPSPSIETAKSAVDFTALVQNLKRQNWTLDNIEEALHAPFLADFGYGLRFGWAELDAAYAHEGSATNAGYNTTEKGQILKGDPYNIRLALGRVQVSLRRNDFSNETEVTGLADFEGELTDAAANRLRFRIHESQGFLPPVEEFERVSIPKTPSI
jgi:hypothetical protein